MQDAEPDNAPLTTADGVPLKTSLQKALRKKKTSALLLVAPLFLFILVTFLLPIFDMLLRSVDNKIAEEILPSAIPVLSLWDESSDKLPGEDFFKALVTDIQKAARDRTINKLGKRLNYDKPGMSSLFRKTGRKLRRFDPSKLKGSYKEHVLALDRKWKDIETYRFLKRESSQYTSSYYLSALDAQKTSAGIERKAEESRIYMKLFGRTLGLSLLITILTIILGYPISYLMATVKTRTSNMLMILVLLPFWTSLLVRTSAWIAILQQEGVVNDLLVTLGLISNDNRLVLIHNKIGTVVAMTHILLPFMILPLYSVMKTIPPSYMRAALSMGASPFTAFRRIYFPNTIPGIGAGGILVFIMAIGYYITPALVGGTEGTLISNFIAYHISTSLNWGLAAALGAILLAVVVSLYIIYDKLVGIDNMKLG